MPTHTCTSPSCEEPADQAAAFCFRHAAMVPARQLDELNRAWCAMNRSVEESAVSQFYEVRQQALDAAMPELSGRSVGDASGPFRRLFGFLSGERSAASDAYKGDIASVSRAQDASFSRKHGMEKR